MKFPTRQADLTQMATTMIKGYYDHSEDFPSVNKTALLLELNKYKNYIKTQLDKQADLAQAIKNKNTTLDSLQTIMKSCIKKSIVDTKANPVKLALIGWAPRNSSHPEPIPGAPKDLKAYKVDNLLYLSWEKFASNSSINCYIIECRVRSNTTKDFGPWNTTGTSIDTRFELKNNSKAIHCEYRIRAINTSGKSAPSNTVSAVL